MRHWPKAIAALSTLVALVRGPQQAQAAWELATTLQRQALPPASARRLGAAVSQLLAVALAAGDFSLLSQLLAHRPGFSFGAQSFERLLRSAVEADVELDELQRLLVLVPPSQVSARPYYVLIQFFESKRLTTEALHCFQQLQAAGRKLSPGMQATLAALRDGRAAAARQSQQQAR